jgi:uncharacterized protein (DUF3820 family)
MNTNKTEQPLHARLRRRVLAGAVGGGMLFSGLTAQAIGPVQETGPALFQHITNQINTYTQQLQDYAEYGENAMRWRNTFTYYQQQLMKMQAIIMSFGMPKGVELKEVPDDYMVANKCGGGFSLANLTKVFNFNASGNLVEQQQLICSNIQITENKKYNETVRFMQRTAPELKRLLKEAESRRNRNNEPSTAQTANNDSGQISNTLEVEFKTWETQISMYDAFIASMRESQKILAQTGLKGVQNPLGTLVKTAALKTALTVGK